MNYLYPLLAVALWSGNTIVSKLSADVLSPVEISFLRWLIAAIVLTPFCLKYLVQYRAVVIENIWRLIALAALGAIVYQTFAYYAARYTSAINMGIIMALMPVMAIILSCIIFRHLPGVSTIIGCLISLLGVLMIVSQGNFSGLWANGVNRGDLLMVAANFAMALYNNLLKKWKIDIPLILTVYIQAIVAAVFFAPLYAIEPKHVIDIHSGSMVIYASIGASILAPLFWMRGASRLGPSSLSLFFNLIPVLTAALAISFLSEKFTWYLVIGGAMTLSGLVIVEYFKRTKFVASPSTPTVDEDELADNHFDRPDALNGKLGALYRRKL